MTIFRKLSWKIAVLTGLLVLFVAGAITFPIYWQTRQALEQQLNERLQQNMHLLAAQFDRQDIAFLLKFAQSQHTRQRIDTFLTENLTRFGAQALYLLSPDHMLIAVAGNRLSALQSCLVNKQIIEQTIQGRIGTSPLFADENKVFYKSAFAPLKVDDSTTCVIGMDASAGFLIITVQLQRQIITVTVLTVFVSMLIALFFAKSLSLPVEKLTHYALAIGRGDYQTDLPIRRQDEIGFLGRTMQKMRSEILRREKENKQLLASVAHEIRNPLAGLKINTELLEESGHLTSDMQKCVLAISREVKRLSQVIDSFLAYARPIEATLELTDLRALLTDSITSVRRDFPTHNFSIQGAGQVQVNPGKLRHCFDNLLKNAAEAAPANTPIEIELNAMPTIVQITFTNYGPAIPAAVQAQLFEAFFSTKENGVGLGLAITKSIVEQHGGRIYLQRSDDSGTVFVIELPGTTS